MATYAVIDLGSNTFHLLIAEFSEGRIKPLIKKRFFTKLSDGGVNYIKPERYQAGLVAVRQFAEILSEFNQPQLRVIGTAVLRQASNRSDFIYEIENILQTPVEIIDGHQEADYIFKGVTLLEGIRSGTHLIMDIGGGSTEFILVRNGEKIWSKSYDLGVCLLYSAFQVSDPMTSGQYEQIRQYIIECIQDMKEIVTRNPVSSLTGASGSFEILQSMTGRSIESTQLDAIETIELNQVFQQIFGKHTQELRTVQGLPTERAPLATTGLTLMKTICDELDITTIQVSPYALKEGVIRDVVETENMNLEELIRRHKGTIVDVRSHVEFQGGHVVDSVLVPYDQLERQKDLLLFLKPPLILVCRSGNRSRMASEKLKSMGIKAIDGGSWTFVNFLTSQRQNENKTTP